jgi:hypothetical protein
MGFNAVAYVVMISYAALCRHPSKGFNAGRHVLNRGAGSWTGSAPRVTERRRRP